ncbi:BTAD domain-containing putative transcriptional regulator [Micromonospora sp. DT228]|uniref:AfsR/SARP family transcriptional regulator n=1 Tax=Micromonospora sp. DT228 TaxID=3393443 RepID=UPI003CEBBE62
MSNARGLPQVAFGLLGPLSVVVDGAPVIVGAAKMRIVLASLLLRRGEVVSVDMLVERLWDEQPPPGARNAVQTYIRRLRALLGAAGRVIVTSAPGYYIDVPAAAVDIDQFRRHVELARSAASAGDIEAEDQELRAGLTLWRGVPLSDVESESLSRDELPVLIEERLEAQVARFDVDLRLGRHAELIAELRGLVAEHPLREGLWHQLMLALYRSHRQAEALSVFRQVRTLLRDELGVDPSAELVELHQRMISGDPELHGHREPTNDGWVSVCQLPPEVHDFVGRSESVEQIRSVVAATGGSRTGLPLAVLTGPPGVGKTELAIHVAYQLRAEFPDGQLFVNLRGFSLDASLRTEEVLGGFLRALGVPAERVPRHPDEQGALFRSLMAGRRVLLVLDNAGSPDQVRPLLPGDAACAVIVTSRDSLIGLSAVNGARRVQINPVSRAEAEALLSRIIGADRTGAEPAAVADLATACGYLPLALRIAASNLAAMPDQRIAAHVRELRSEDRLRAFAVDGDDQASVRATFDLSYRALRPEVARLFRLLSLVPGSNFDLYAAASLAGVSPAEARRMLASLTTASLVEHLRNGRYEFHDLLRDYAGWQARQDSHEVRLAAARRLLDYFLRAADAASGLLYADFPRLPHPDTHSSPEFPNWTDPLDALAWLEAEVMNLVATVGDPLLQESGAPVWLLADSLLGYFVRQRQDIAWPDTLRRALEAAERAADPHATAALQRGMGRLHFRRNEYAEARASYQRSARLSQKLGDRAGEGRDVIGLGNVAFELQNYIEAARCYEEALPLLRESGDRDGVAIALVNLGITLIMIGRSGEGAERLDEGKKIAEDLGLRNLAPRATSGLAMLDSWCGRFEESAAGFASVLSDWSDLGYVQGQAETLRNMAEVHLESRRATEALAMAEQALGLAEQMDAKWMAMGAHVTLAEAHLRLGDAGSARRSLTAAAALTATGGGYWYPFVLVNLAACYRLAGDHETAVELALDVAENQRPRLRARAFVELALISVAIGDHAAAVRYARSALETSIRYGYRPDEDRARTVLRQAAGQQVADDGSAVQAGDLDESLVIDGDRPTM